MSTGIIDIRVITESPWKLSVFAGVVFFGLSSWQVPASILSTLPGFGGLTFAMQSIVLKTVLVVALVWFVLRYKKAWILQAVAPDAPPNPTSASSKG